MKFHTDPKMALKMANAEESDGIDDIDDLFDAIKYNSTGATQNIKDKITDIDIGDAFQTLVATNQ